MHLEYHFPPGGFYPAAPILHAGFSQLVRRGKTTVSFRVFPTKAWTYLSQPNICSQHRHGPSLKVLILVEERDRNTYMMT